MHTPSRRVSLRRKRPEDKSEESQSKKSSPSPPVIKDNFGASQKKSKSRTRRNSPSDSFKTPTKPGNSKKLYDSNCEITPTKTRSTSPSNNDSLDTSGRTSPESFLCSQLSAQQECEVVWDCNSPGYSKEDLKRMYPRKNKSLFTTPSPVILPQRRNFQRPRALITKEKSPSSDLSAELDALLSKITSEQNENSSSELIDENTPDDDIPNAFEATQPFESIQDEPSTLDLPIPLDDISNNDNCNVNSDDNPLTKSRHFSGLDLHNNNNDKISVNNNENTNCNFDIADDDDDLFFDDFNVPCDTPKISSKSTPKFSSKNTPKLGKCTPKSTPKSTPKLFGKNTPKSSGKKVQGDSKSSNTTAEPSTINYDDSDLFDDDLFNDSVLQCTQAIEEQLYNKEKGCYDTPSRIQLDKNTPKINAEESNISPCTSTQIYSTPKAARPKRATFQLGSDCSSSGYGSEENNSTASTEKKNSVNSLSSQAETLKIDSIQTSTSFNKKQNNMSTVSSNFKSNPIGNNQFNSYLNKNESQQSLSLNKPTAQTMNKSRSLPGNNQSKGNGPQSDKFSSKSVGLPRSKSTNYGSHLSKKSDTPKSSFKRFNSTDSPTTTSNATILDFETDDDYLFELIEDEEIEQSLSQQALKQIENLEKQTAQTNSTKKSGDFLFKDIKSSKENNQDSESKKLPGNTSKFSQHIPNKLPQTAQLIPNKFAQTNQNNPSKLSQSTQNIPNKFGKINQNIPNKASQAAQNVPNRLTQTTQNIPNRISQSTNKVNNKTVHNPPNTILQPNQMPRKSFSISTFIENTKSSPVSSSNNSNGLMKNKTIHNGSSNTSNVHHEASTNSQVPSSTPRCSQAEIARKKEEALRRRAAKMRNSRPGYNPVC